MRTDGRTGAQAEDGDMKLTAAFGYFANASKKHHPSVAFLYISVNDKLQYELSVSGSVHTPVFRKESVRHYPMALSTRLGERMPSIFT
jgi:hypothetical protein